MRLCKSPDIFQDKMGELMADLEFIRVYIYDFFSCQKDLGSHLDKVKIVFEILHNAGLKINAKNIFGRMVLGFMLLYYQRRSPTYTKKGTCHLKIKSHTKKQVRTFIVMIND